MYLVKIIILSAFLLFACEKRPGQEEYMTIEKLPQSERLEKFSSYPVEKQIDVCLFTQLYLEGGSGTYKNYLAADGADKISAITERLDKTNDLLIKLELISAIELINMSCLCVADNQEIIKVLEKNKMSVLDSDSEVTISGKNAYNDYLQRIKLKK